MTTSYGYIGKILKIDLTEGSITTLNTEEYAAKYLGGRGIADRIYWNEVKPEVAAFDPENALIFMTGPLTGTVAPTSNRTHLVAKSPAIFPHEKSWGSSCGGHWGPELKLAGFDGIVIKGKAHGPVYLWVHDGEVEIKEALPFLWGLDTWAAQEELWRIHGDKTKVLTIGPAGENLCREAIILSDSRDCFGHGGFGAVMGSKNLKAIAVSGSGIIKIARPKELLEVSYHTQRLLSHKVGEEGPVNTRRMQAISDGIYAAFEAPVEVSALEEESKAGTVRLAPQACFGCPLACQISFKYLDGSGVGGLCCQDYMAYSYLPAAYYKTKWLDRVTTKAAMMFDRLGLSISFVSEQFAGMREGPFYRLIRMGVFNNQNTGLPCDKIGSEEFITKLLHKITYREGIGNDLAEGLARFFEKLGGEAIAILKEDFLPHGELNNILVGNFTGCKPLPDLIASTRDRERREILSLVDVFGLMNIDLKVVPLGSKKRIQVRKKAGLRWIGSEEAFLDMSSLEYAAPIAILLETGTFVSDTLSLCNFVFPMFYSNYTPDNVGKALAAKIYSAVTGIDLTEEDLNGVFIPRILALERLISIREGYTIENEKLPDVLFKDSGGPYDRAAFGQALENYYKARGWDTTTGIPKRATLEKLNLEDIADELENGYRVTIPK